MSHVFVFLADGFEEIEGLTVVDILRRAGQTVTTVSVMGEKEITGAHAIEVKADAVFEETDFSDADMLVLPGGMPGTNYLAAHKELGKLLQQKTEEGKYIAAICAAPSVLGGLGILDGRKACCYPGFEGKLGSAEAVSDPVTRDGQVITSRGMGTAIPFALKLTEVLTDAKTAAKVGSSIIYS